MILFADSALVVARTIQLLGGRERAWQIVDVEFSSMTHRWNQDVESIGRIPRSHLYVEHYLTEYLEKANPRLGRLSAARLTFNQKTALLDSENPRLADVVSGIRHLNKIRNRLSHQLTASITKEDAAVFLDVKLFKAMRDEGAKPALASEDPLDILEEFARHASSRLSNELGSFSKAFAQALNELTPNSAM